jgi:hypothetical protein
VVIARVTKLRGKLGLALGAVVLLGGASIGACTWLEDSPPPATCSQNSDCFQAQGEVCNLAKQVCEVKMDAGVATIDAAPSDAAIDATLALTGGAQGAP